MCVCVEMTPVCVFMCRTVMKISFNVCMEEMTNISVLCLCVAGEPGSTEQQ